MSVPLVSFVRGRGVSYGRATNRYCKCELFILCSPPSFERISFDDPHGLRLSLITKSTFQKMNKPTQAQSKEGRRQKAVDSQESLKVLTAFCLLPSVFICACGGL